jgi:hypothetical protein
MGVIFFEFAIGEFKNTSQATVPGSLLISFPGTACSSANHREWRMNWSLGLQGRAVDTGYSAAPYGV